MILDYDETAQTVRVSGLTLMERCLIQVGSERSAIDHCRRLYGLDRKTARLLVRAVRDGEEANDE